MMSSGDLRVGNRVIVDAPLAGVYKERGMIIHAVYDSSTSMADIEVDPDVGGVTVLLTCTVSGGELSRVVLRGKGSKTRYYAADVRLVQEPGTVTAVRKRAAIEKELAGDAGASEWITKLLFPF